MSSATRRRFLQTTLLAGGGALSLADVLKLQAASKSNGSSSADTAVIQIWLGGGPSQFETFDPKPHAPVEIRGPYAPIQTAFPGILACEKMPLTSQVLDKTALIRSFSHTTNGHFVGAHWCVTGYIGTNNRASHPCNGSMASLFRGANQPGMPAHVQLSHEQTRNPEIGSVMGPGHLGVGHSAFTVLQDPYRDEFHQQALTRATSNLTLADDVTLDRVGDRSDLMRSLDRLPRLLQSPKTMRGMDRFTQAALEMVSTGQARNAFDLSRESSVTRRNYGSHRWGQMALLARRLVEAGVTFVTLNLAPDSLCWDWHLNIVDDNRPADGSLGPSRGMNHHGPPLDRMLWALINDLYERGLDKKVLVVVWGEFGRTPRVNKTGGRDHWGSLMSMLMIGGGLKMGQVIGASSEKGEVPTDRPVHPTDVLATMYRHLRIDPHQNTINTAGRPIPVLPGGKVIRELV